MNKSFLELNFFDLSYTTVSSSYVYKHKVYLKPNIISLTGWTKKN